MHLVGMVQLKSWGVDYVLTNVDFCECVFQYVFSCLAIWFSWEIIVVFMNRQLHCLSVVSGIYSETQTGSRTGVGSLRNTSSGPIFTVSFAHDTGWC